MSQNLLDQFAFPQVAMDDFISKGLTQKVLESGGGGLASSFEMSGHDKGVAFRFFKVPVKMEALSEEMDMELNKEIEMIQWMVDKFKKPTERVHMIGDNLLRFRKEKAPNGVMLTKFPLEVVSGAYKEAYLRFKEGLGVSGLPLTQWDKCGQAQAATFASENIHTVQQLAARSEESMSRFPVEFRELFKAAIHWVNAQAPMVDIQKNAEAMMELKVQLSKEADKNRMLEERLAALEAGQPEKKKAGRPKKIITDEMSVEA